MSDLSVVQVGTGVLVASSVALADSWWPRFRGLLARRPLEKGEGLLLLECGNVHTVGMSYPIDVAFLDDQGNVVRQIERLGPWRVGWGGPSAVHTLELPAGRLGETGTGPGVQLRWS